MIELTPRERRRKQRLDEIIDVSMAMIVEDGIHAFGINKLAEKLELTPGALYRYFDSKDAILASVEIRVLEEFERYFEAIDAALQEAEPLERIVAMTMGYAALQTERPERFNLMSYFVSGPEPLIRDDVASDVVGPTIRVLGRLSGAVLDAMHAGVLSEEKALQRAALAWSCVQGVLDRRKLTRFSPEIFEIDALLLELVRTLLVGWGGEPDRVARAIEHRPPATFFSERLKELE